MFDGMAQFFDREHQYSSSGGTIGHHYLRDVMGNPKDQTGSYLVPPHGAF